MTTARVVVAGGGVTGLTAAFTLQEEAARLGVAAEVTVIDAAPDVGGHARTVVDGPWVIEMGPNGFLDREPETLALVKELGLEARLVEANPAARRRFIVRRGELCLVPESPPALLTSPLIGWRAKLRLMREPWAAAPPLHADETVFEFAERRFGREVAETVVDPAVSGISGGDSKVLSVRSQFPILKEWEHEHGSLLRAMLAQRKKSKGRAKLLSFDRGLGSMTSALASRLRTPMKTGHAIAAIDRHQGLWRVHLADGSATVADHVVLTTPAHRTATILRPLDRELWGDLSSIPSAGLAVVALAYPAASLPRPLDGYGYLVTRAEGLSTIGVLWESSIFPGRAPHDAALLRVFLGGARLPGVLDLDEAALIAVARGELATVMGLTAMPIRHWVFRWPAAIAQYTSGHAGRVNDIRARVAAHHGLHICGTALDGVSFNQAISAARRTAREVASNLTA